MKKIKYVRKKSETVTIQEREAELFKNFNGARKNSRSYKIKDLDKAAELIKKHLHNKIRIVGDYDVDGMTSDTEMLLLLKHFNATDVQFTNPYRFTEGYGLSIAIIDRFLPEIRPGEGLLITVDNGITAHDAMEEAKRRGWDILIIDHHLPMRNTNNVILYPVADVIIDPHAVPGQANFDDYCGAGLCYKLAQEMITDDNGPTMMKITSLAAIGTIADAVEFIRKVGGAYAYDNFLIVKNGLQTLKQNAGRTTGLYCLLRANNHDYDITPDNIGYIEGPQLNSPSRLYDAGSISAVDLLALDDNNFSKADVLAQELLECNKIRKEITEEILPKLIQRIEASGIENDYPMVVKGNDGEIHHGIIGILAGRLAEMYQTDAIVCTPVEGTDIFKGSARALEGSDIKSILDGASDLLEGYGGHKLAAGLSVSISKFEEFRKRIQTIAGKKPEEFFYRYYDYDLDVEKINETIEILKKSGPFGKGHEMPLFRVPFEIASYKIMGKDNKTIKFVASGNSKVEALGFRGEAIRMYEELEKPSKMYVYGTLAENEFMGNITPQIIIQHLDVE